MPGPTRQASGAQSYFITNQSAGDAPAPTAFASDHGQRKARSASTTGRLGGPVVPLGAAPEASASSFSGQE